MKNKLFVIPIIIIFSFLFSINVKVNASSSSQSFMFYDQDDDEEYLITDRDPYTINVVETLDFENLTGQHLYLWGEAGYDTITLTFYFSAKEIDKGYQKIYVYPTSNSTNMIDELEFELAGTSLCEEYISCQYVLGLTMEECLASDSTLERLYIRFGAHGNNDDDWMFYGMRIKITIS